MSEVEVAVDVSDVDLYEQAKRILRQALPQLGIRDRDGRPFVLTCHECGLPFRLDIEVGMIAEHGRLEHGLDVDAGDLTIDLVWIGEGPPPRGE